MRLFTLSSGSTIPNAGHRPQGTGTRSQARFRRYRQASGTRVPTPRTIDPDRRHGDVRPFFAVHRARSVSADRIEAAAEPCARRDAMLGPRGARPLERASGDDRLREGESNGTYLGLPIPRYRRSREEGGQLGGHPCASRRQGREPGRHDAPGRAGPARLHRHHRGVQRLPRGRRDVPGRRLGSGDGGPPGGRGGHRQELRRPEPSAAGLLPLRREVQHARHDGHDPQHRPQRRGRRGAHPTDRRSPLRVGQLPPPGPDVRQRGPLGTGRGVRGRDHRPPQDGRRHRRQPAGRRRLARGHPQVQGDRPHLHRPRLPRGSVRAAAPRDRGGVQVVERQARP